MINQTLCVRGLHEVSWSKEIKDIKLVSHKGGLSSLNLEYMHFIYLDTVLAFVASIPLASIMILSGIEYLNH